jgi:4-oxalmesaconate hydratase
VVARQCSLHPIQLKGIAGLPQQAGASPASCAAELERCITELGFVGCSITPDPEGGVGARTPGMREEYWYPLYEMLVRLDVPAIIHSSGSCSARASNSVHHIVEETVAAVSLLETQGDLSVPGGMPPNRVFQDFPTLKLIISHGGGAIPYQIGRFKAVPYRSGGERFEDMTRRLYYDTCVYSRNGLDLLFKEMGPDRCVFGAEAPGQGSSIDPNTGEPMDDLRPVVESIEWLSPADREIIFEGNAKALFKL